MSVPVFCLSIIKTCCKPKQHAIKNSFLLRDTLKFAVAFAIARKNYSTEPALTVKSPTAEEFATFDTDKKRNLIEAELEILRQSGEYHVPNTPMSDLQWEEILKLNSYRRRREFYRYLKTIETSLERKRTKAEARKAMKLEANNQIELNSRNGYGLWRNSFIIKKTNSTMIQFYNHNLRDAVLFGQKFVVDLGFHEEMNIREIKSCCDQLQNLYGANKIDSDPFHLHFCNLPSMDSDFTKRLMKSLPPLQKENGLTMVTEKSYLDLFPKENIVYLTPDCDEDLKYNHDDVYIIGGLVDRGPSKPLTRAKAEREGLRMARLPLDSFLDWGLGKKALTLDQMMKILLTAKNTSGDWHAALQHVPTRKVRKS